MQEWTCTRTCCNAAGSACNGYSTSISCKAYLCTPAAELSTTLCKSSASLLLRRFTYTQPEWRTRAFQPRLHTVLRCILILTTDRNCIRPVHSVRAWFSRGNGRSGTLMLFHMSHRAFVVRYTRQNTKHALQRHLVMPGDCFVLCTTCTAVRRVHHCTCQKKIPLPAV